MTATCDRCGQPLDSYYWIASCDSKFCSQECLDETPKCAEPEDDDHG